MKTDHSSPDRAEPEVKTEKLPYTYQKRGCWYFRCSDAHVPLAGEYGSPDFLGHYYGLCDLFGVGTQPEDPRSVYFIGWEGGPIKIGLADNVQVRRDTLQIGCPYELKVLAVTTGGMRRELEYHRRFENWRLRGEWFVRCEQIETEIAKLADAPNHPSQGGLHDR